MKVFLPQSDQPLTVRGVEIHPADTPEEYLRKLARIALDQMLHFVGVLTPGGILLECSPTALETRGLTREDVVGQPLWETIGRSASPKTRDDLRDAVRRAAQGESVRCEVEGCSGTESAVSDFTLLPVRDENGRVVLLLSEIHDISGKADGQPEIAPHNEPAWIGHPQASPSAQESTHELKRRTTQFATVLNQAPFGVYFVDADFRICEINPVALPIFGDIPGGLIGRDFDEIIRILWEKEYADEIVRIFRRTLETGEPYVTSERGGRRADRGTVEYYEWRTNRIFLPDGRFGVVCYFRDISDRRQAEQNAILLSSIVESSDDAIVSKDLNGVILSWNRGAERLFGYTAAEAVGQSITIIIPPDRLDEESGILDRLKRGERVDHFETIRRRQDGTLLNVSLTISPLKDTDGRVIGASKVARDITDRVRYEEAMQEANAALKRANADLQQFAYSASHDLQEPLRMIAIYSELLQKRFAEKLGPTGEEFISHTVQGAKRLASLLQDLRTYTQVSTSEQGPADEVDAVEVLKKALFNLESVIKDSGAVVTHGHLPKVRMIEFQLEQVFQNLIGNAIRYRSNLPPRIHIRAVPEGKHCRFSVEDNGIGIEPKFTEQIFGIFKRLHSANEYPGTGMGLAICQRIVERAGGRIWVESEPGRGSTFYFTVPCGDPWMHNPKPEDSGDSPDSEPTGECGVPA